MKNATIIGPDASGGYELHIDDEKVPRLVKLTIEIEVDYDFDFKFKQKKARITFMNLDGQGDIQHHSFFPEVMEIRNG